VVPLPVVTPPKKMGHHHRCNAPLEFEMLMLEAEGETGSEFVEIENCCELKNTIDSSGLDNIPVMCFLWLTYFVIVCVFGKVMFKK
jgi:hypothetical protein